MSEYSIKFVDGDVLKGKGTVKTIDNAVYCYKEDGIIQYLVPIFSIKYIHYEGESERQV